MSPEQWPPRLARSLAWAIALLLVLVGWQLAFRPLLALDSGYRAAIEQSRRELGWLGSRAAGREALQERLVALEAESDEEGMIEAASDVQAAAAMQAILVRVAAGAGVTLRSVTVAEPTAEGRFRRIALEADLSLDDEALRALLLGLETTRPWLLVERITLGGSQALNWPRPDGKIRSLDCRLRLFGYARQVPA